MSEPTPHRRPPRGPAHRRPLPLRPPLLSCRRLLPLHPGLRPARRHPRHPGSLRTRRHPSPLWGKSAAPTSPATTPWPPCHSTTPTAPRAACTSAAPGAPPPPPSSAGSSANWALANASSAIDGAVSCGNLEAGQSAGLVERIEPAAIVVFRIAAGYLGIVARLPGSAPAPPHRQMSTDPA